MIDTTLREIERKHYDKEVLSSHDIYYLISNLKREQSQNENLRDEVRSLERQIRKLDALTHHRRKVYE